jgi:hypothetical protein
MRKSPFRRFIIIDDYLWTIGLVIFIACCIYGYFRSKPQETSQQVSPTVELFNSVPLEPNQRTPVQRVPHTSVQAVTPSSAPSGSENKYDPEEDAILSGQKTTNFTVFQDKLVLFLQEGYSESFARELSFALIKAIHEGRGNEEGTRDTISKFLGKESTPEKIAEILKGINKAVETAGESLPPISSE